jgi:uncharacterized phage-like protein YoqJ
MSYAQFFFIALANHQIIKLSNHQIIKLINMDLQNITVCFTGHRSYVPRADDEARLAEALEAAWADGYRVFISGMAPGFDLAAAEAVQRLKASHSSPLLANDGGPTQPDGVAKSDREAGPSDGIRLIAAIPFPGQPRGYTDEDRRRYDTLLDAADEVRVLADRYSHGCYYRRDDWMVDRSARIVCWYDSTRRGTGTRYTVRRALRRGLEIVNTFRPSHYLLFDN